MKEEKLDCFIVEEMLSDYIDGREMGEGSCREKIGRHLESCAACRNAEAELRFGMDLFKIPATAEDAPPDEFSKTFLSRLAARIATEKALQTRKHRRLRVVAAAAAVIIAVGGGILLKSYLAPLPDNSASKTEMAQVFENVMDDMQWGGAPEKLAVSVKEQAIIDKAVHENIKAKVESEPESSDEKKVVTKEPEYGAGYTEITDMDHVGNGSNVWLSIDETESADLSQSLEYNMKVLHNR